MATRNLEELVEIYENEPDLSKVAGAPPNYRDGVNDMISVILDKLEEVFRKLGIPEEDS